MKIALERPSLPAQLESGLEQTQLAGLDGMRAIAAFLVVFHHFGVPMVSGGIGVLMFFVLSGFLITWLLLRENDELGKVSLRDFYIRRALRIFPAFYCYAAVALAVVLVRHTKFVLPQTVAALLYAGNYYQALHGDPDTGFSHTWSLAIEEQFYLLWPMAFVALRNDYQRMARFLAGAILTIWIYRELLVFVFRANQGYIYEAFDARADHLLTGCLLAVALRTRLVPRFWGWVCARPWTAAVTAGLLALSSAGEALYGHIFRDSVSSIANPVLTAIWIPQLIAMRGIAPWSWMGWPWVRYLGRVSYSVYLYQQLLTYAPKTLLPHQAAVVQLAAAAVLIVAAASLSHYFVERPFLMLKTRFKRTAAGAAP